MNLIKYQSKFFLLSLLLISLLCLFSSAGLANEKADNEQETDDKHWDVVLDINGTVNEYRIPINEIDLHTIDVDGRPFYFVEMYRDREKGPKPLIIFVHGTPGSWAEYTAFLTNDFLRDHFHMISVDRLGHGGSEGKVEPSLTAQAASLKALLSKNTSDSGVILVGHSLGGPIIARTALDYPEQVGGLVFIASTADPKHSHRWYNTLGGFLPISWFVPRNLRRANKEILPLKKQLKAMQPLWQNIKVPTTIIQGGKDKHVNPKNAEYIQKALVNAKVNRVILPEADHFIHWENPQLLVDALGTFVPQAKQEVDILEPKKQF